MSEDYVLFGHPTNSSTYASANFDMPETYFQGLEGGTEIQPIVSQSLTKHVAEVPSKPVTNMNNWRKHLREIMLQQTDTVLNFLVKPATEQQVLGPVESLLRKFSVRKEIDASALKTLAELLAESPGPKVEKEINECLAKAGPSTLNEVREQVSSLIEVYKKTGESILESEYQLKLRVEKLSKVHKQVASILDLQMNDETEGLLKGMEKYLETSAKDLCIEEVYKDLIHLYAKHMALREAIQVVKTGTCLQSEPWCSICISDTISYAIVPCGHTFCVGCSRKMVYDCGICRTRIKERLKIYIS